MKSFIFKNIWLYSRADRGAKSIEFHPSKNLIVGINHTGKSSLIKHLFLTMGSTPTGKLDKWDDNAISVVKFSINQTDFLAVYQRGYRALFKEDSLLFASNKSHDWNDALSKI